MVWQTALVNYGNYFSVLKKTSLYTTYWLPTQQTSNYILEIYSIFLSPFQTMCDLYIALSHKTDQYLHTSFHIILLVSRKHWKCQDQSSSTGIVAPSQMKRRLWWKVLIKTLPSLKEYKFQTWMLEASLLCHRLKQLSISDMVPSWPVR